jgi:hypothetical protein
MGAVSVSPPLWPGWQGGNHLPCFLPRNGQVELILQIGPELGALTEPMRQAQRRIGADMAFFVYDLGLIRFGGAAIWRASSVGESPSSSNSSLRTPSDARVFGSSWRGPPSMVIHDLNVFGTGRAL